MSQDNPQQVVDPNPGPALDQMPSAQPSPASPTGPDSHSMPQISQVLGTSERDYEASYKGLNTRYQQDRQLWESERSALRAEVDAIKASLAPPPEPVVDAPVIEEPQAINPLETAIQQKQAEQYRDLLVSEYTKPGATGEGLPLNMFTANIQIKPPTISEDGSLDDSAQRAEIESLVNALKGVQGVAKTETAKAIVTGQTVGSAPGAPTAPGPNDVYQEFQELMSVYGSKEYIGLEDAEQARIEARYYELLNDPAVEELHGGDTAPTQSVAQLQRTVRDLSKQVAQYSGGNPLKNAL